MLFVTKVNFMIEISISLPVSIIYQKCASDSVCTVLFYDICKAFAGEGKDLNLHVHAFLIRRVR